MDSCFSERDREICKIYQEGKLGSASIGRQFSIASATVRRILRSYNIPIRRRGVCCVADQTPLSDGAVGAIYGTLLGDACISLPQANRTPKLLFDHCLAQKAYMEHKVACLTGLVWKTTARMSGKYPAVRAVSSVHRDLWPIYNTVKPGGGKKTVTEEWLRRISPMGLALWHMDDGNVEWGTRSCRVNLHTEGFSLEEQHILVKWLGSLGYTAVIQARNRNNHKLYRLRLNSAAAGKWIDSLIQFAIPCMMYKFRNPKLLDSQEPIESRELLAA